jgi:HK97 family phage portal protein
VATLRQRRAAERNRDEERYSFDDFVQWKTAANATFPVGAGASLGVAAGFSGSKTSEGSDDLAAIYKANGTVFACMGLRQAVFAEITFRYAAMDKGRLGKMFGTPDLSLLEHPWPNGTTGELATRMIQDVDLAGNFYAIRRGDRLYRRDPTRTHIVLAGNPLEEEFVDVAGYVYQPQGSGGPLYTYLPEQMCHWSPIPDPQAEYRGMSWLTPLLREIKADNAATDHKLNFFLNGATPNVVVKFPPDVMNEKEFERFKAKMHQAYDGVSNAYKTLYLAPGADVEVVGTSLQQLSFDETQGRDETRIAAAAGVPAALVGLKESLKGSSLNTGNYSAARRRFADATMRPLYRSAAAALETLVPPPTDKGPARLWYDDSQVAFFREDRGDAATIQQTKSTTVKQLVDAGYTPESVVHAVEQEDITLLQHSGLYSVQLQPPNSQQPQVNP